MIPKELDLVFVIVGPLVVFGAVFACSWQITHLEALLLVFGIPCLFLSLEDTEKLRKISAFVLFVSVPMALIFGIIATGDNAWVVPQFCDWSS